MMSPLEAFRRGGAYDTFTTLADRPAERRRWLLAHNLIVWWHRDGSFDLAFRVTPRRPPSARGFARIPKATDG